MTRGRAAVIGSETISQNGYTYIRTHLGWRLKHHVIAEERLGRTIDSAKERVIFKDGNRQNLDPDNIEVVPVKNNGKSKAARIARLEAKIEDLQHQIDDIRKEPDY